MSANSSEYDEDQFDDPSPQHQTSKHQQQSPRMMQIVGIEHMRGSMGKGAVSAAQSSGFSKKVGEKQKEGTSPFQTKTQPLNFEQIDNMQISDVAYKSEFANNNSEHEKYANSQLNIPTSTQKSGTANARPANKETPKRDTKPKMKNIQRKQMSNKSNFKNEEEMEFNEAKRGSKTSSSMFPDMPARQTGSAKHTAKQSSIGSNKKVNQAVNIRQAIKYRSNQGTVHETKKNSATMLLEKPFQNRRPQKMQNFMLKKIESGQSVELVKNSRHTIPQIIHKQHQDVIVGTQTATNAYSSVHQNALNDDNPHLYIHSSGKPPVSGIKNENRGSTKKDPLVGKPYKVKTKLPYYDSRGTFQSGRVGLKQEIQGGSPQIPNTLKIRSTSHNLSGQLTRDRSSNPSQLRNQAKVSNEAQLPQHMAQNTVSGTSRDRQSSAQRQPIGEELEHEEQDENRIGAVAAATKIHNLQQIYGNGQKPFRVESNKSLKSNSAYNSKRRIDNDLNRNVEEVHFTHSVAGISQKPGRMSGFINRSPGSRRNINSQQSLEMNPRIECAKHAEIIHQLETRVQEMQDEVKIKDNLVNKLLDEEQQLRYALKAHKTDTIPERPHSRSSSNTRNKDMINKLKAELNIAYKILSKRDIQLHTLQKNVKAIAFNQCNNERINYLNECLKLQRLLKVYGNPRQKFKGVQVTQGKKTKQPSRLYPLDDIGHSSEENTEQEGEDKKIFNVISKSSEGDNEQIQRLIAENTEMREEIEELKEKLANQPIHDKTLELDSARNSNHAEHEKKLSEVQMDCDNKIQEIKSILEDTMKDKESLREQHSLIEVRLDEKTRFIDSLEQELEASVEKALNLQKLLDTQNRNEAERLLQEQVDKLSQEITQLKTENGQLQQENSKQQQEISKQQQEILKLQQDNEKVAQEKSDLNHQIGQLSKEKNEQENKVLQLEQEMSLLNEQSQNLQKENDSLKKELDQMKSEAANHKKELDQEQALVATKPKDESNVELEKKYNDLVKETDITIKEQKQQISDAQKQIGELQEGQQSQIKEIEKLNDEIENLQNNVYTLEQERDEKEEKVEELSKQNELLSSDNNKMKDQIENFKTQINNVDNELEKFQQAKPATKELESEEEVQKVEPVKDAAEPSKEELQRAVSDGKNEVVNFLMQNNEKLETKIKDLEKEIKDKEEANEKDKQEQQVKIDNLQKERDSLEQKIEEFKIGGKDPQQLKAMISQKNEEYESLEFQKQELEDQVDELQKELEQAKEKVGVTEVASNLQAKKSLGQGNNIEDKIIQAQSGLLDRLEKSKTKVKDLESRLKETENDLVLSQEKLHEQGSQLSRRESMSSRREELLNVAESQESQRYSQASGKFDAIPTVQAQLKKQKGDKELQKQELKLLRGFYSQNKSTPQDLQDLQEEIKIIVMERDEFEAQALEKETLSKHIEKIKTEKEALISQNNDHLSTIKELEQEKETMSHEMQKNQDKQLKLEEDLDKAQQQIEAYTNSYRDLEATSNKVDLQLKEVLASQITKNLRLYHVYSEEQLIKYLSQNKSESPENNKKDMEKILQENFNIPKDLVDDLVSDIPNDLMEEKLAKKLFLQIIDEQLIVPSETKQEIGFLTLKQKFEEKGINYRQKIFGLQEKEDDDEILQLYNDQRKASFLTHNDFMDRIAQELDDKEMAEAISIGCQHLSHSPNLVSFLAFDILYRRYNNEKGAAHTMKELLAKQKSEQEEQLRKLEQQRLEEAELARQEKQRIEDELKAEAQRAAQEKERLEQEKKADAERAAQEKERLEQERKAEAEKAAQEKERLEQERKAEAERAENEKRELEKRREQDAEQARLEKEKLEKEKQDAAESARKERERIEKEKADELEKAKLEKERLEKEKTEEAEKARQEREKIDQERAQEAEKAKNEKEQMEKKQKLQLELAQKEKEELEENARKREMEMKLMQAQEPSIDQEDLDHDREGFTPQVFSYVKKNNDLSVITNIANASLFSIRNRCPTYSTQLRRLKLQNTEETFVPLYTQRDYNGNKITDGDTSKVEVDVIKNQDFFEEVLMEMGLKRYVDLPEEAEKLEQMLEKIGALAMASIDGKDTKVILLDILISAMRVHKYDYAGNKLMTSIKGVDFRKLDTKSIRIMNRLTRQTLVYQGKYQEQAQEGVRVTIPQIVGAMFKADIDKKRVARPAVGDGNSSFGTMGGSSKMSTSLQESDVQVISSEKFFAALKKLQIRKTDQVHPNLQNFLKMNEQNKDLVLFKKLVKVVEEFLKNHYLKSYGMKKTKLQEDEEKKEEEDEYDYEYDDEQEEETKQQPASQPQMQQLTLEQAQAQMQAFAAQFAKQQQALAQAQQKPLDQAEGEAEGDVEYYYDEEEPPEEEKQGHAPNMAAQQYNNLSGMNAIPENDEEDGNAWM